MIEPQLRSAEAEVASLELHSQIVLVEPSGFRDFEKRLAALNKKAAAFELPSITITAREEVTYWRRLEYVGRDGDRLLASLSTVRQCKESTPVQLLKIAIRFPIIKLGDWEIAGKLEAAGGVDRDGGILSFCITGRPEDQRELAHQAASPIRCQHCGMKRRRNDSFLLRNAAGEFIQVGRSCLRDFTGVDPGVALFLAKMWTLVSVTEGELEEFLGSRRPNAVATDEFLLHVAFITKAYGFVSTAKASAESISPTYAEAATLPNLLDEDAGVRKKFQEMRSSCEAEAQAARTWMVGLTPSSDFERNCQIIVKADAILRKPKHLALAAALISSYHRAARAPKPPQRPSEHIGEVGQKLALPLTFQRCLPVEGEYGVRHLVIMEDANGNKVTWWASNCPTSLLQAEAGLQFKAKFTIKEHGVYKGAKQTLVTRLKLDP